jgi:hypothetical protein
LLFPSFLSLALPVYDLGFVFALILYIYRYRYYILQLLGPFLTKGVHKQHTFSIPFSVLKGKKSPPRPPNYSCNTSALNSLFEEVDKQKSLLSFSSKEQMIRYGQLFIKNFVMNGPTTPTLSREAACRVLRFHLWPSIEGTIICGVDSYAAL